MADQTKTGFEGTIHQLLAASPKNSSKADPVKAWVLAAFNMKSSVARVTEDKQLGNRITEQFAHQEPIVIFVLEQGVNCASLSTKVNQRRYSKLESVLLMRNSGGSLTYERMLIKSPSAFSLWCEQILGVNAEMFTGTPQSEHTTDYCVRQLITYGAPGSGKSWSVKEWTKGEDTIRTTFHPDSDYSTFVGSYKPSVEKDKFQTVVTAGERNAAGTLNKKDELFTQKRIVYKFVPQAFIKAYVDAWKYKAAANGGEATRKYLVIEEINRGNCAQIFGDLFQLLDRNDEGFSDYEIAADDDLQNYLAEQFADLAKQNESSPINLGVDAKLAKRILSGGVLLLPENLYIWATMNTSDQSLFPIDSAFKRRWEWKYMPIYDAQKDYKIVVDGDVYKWWDFLEKANALVQEFTDSEDKKLGYFFCKADASNTIPLEQFVGKVIFYLWNDVFKDAGFDHAAFDGDNGERLLFKTFFNPDGSPKAATVKKLMQNLGVASTAANASATPAV